MQSLRSRGYYLVYLFSFGIAAIQDVAPRQQLHHLDELARRLTDETRLAILWIKDRWHRMESYPDEVSGIDIYAAVLDHGVRTPGEFAVYLRERGMRSGG